MPEMRGVHRPCFVRETPAAAIEPSVHGHVPQQFGRKAEGLVVHGVVEHDLQRSALLVGLDGRDGRPVARITLLVAIDLASADPVRSDADGLDMLVQQHFVGTSCLGPAVAILDHFIEDLCTQGSNEFHL